MKIIAQFRKILYVALSAVLMLFLLNLLFVYPAFKKFLTEEIKTDAVNTTSHLVSMLFHGDKEISKDIFKDDFIERIEAFRKDFNWQKVKVFSPRGEILYSTDPEEVGGINTKSYFHDIVAKGNPYAEIIKKEARSLEDQVMTTDVVETYVPVMKKNRFAGAFEIYYDITEKKKSLESLIRNSFFLTFFVAILLLGTLIVSSLYSGRSLSRKDEELARSEERYRTMIENSNDLIWTLDINGNFTYFNKKAEDVTGYKLSDWIGKYFGPLISPDDLPRTKNIFSEVLAGGRTSYEVSVMLEHGDRIVLSVNTAPIFESGKIVGTVSFGRDVTEQKRTGEKLVETGQYLENLINHANAPIIVWNPDFRITRFNRSFQHLTGYSEKEVIGRELSMLFPKESRDESIKKIVRTLEGERWESVEIPILKKDGSVRTALWNSANIHAGDGRTLTGTIAQGVDITERIKAENFIKDIFASVDEGIVVIDKGFRIISLNRAYAEMVKKAPEDIIGKPCYEVSHHTYRPCHENGEDCAVKHTFETGMPHKAIHTHYDSEKSPFYIEIRSFPMKDETGKVTSAIEIINDITEKIRLEEQLRHSQKMEAIGAFAGGIAHDFNNILNVISGFGSLLEIRIDRNSPLRSQLEEILSAAERGANLTQSLLAFSRKQIINPRPLNLNKTILNIKNFLSRIIGEDIEIITGFSEKDLIITADPLQIEQVFMNLATNAKAAMPKGGRLTIKTESADSVAELQEKNQRPEEYALISITDTGVGMDENIRENIFEPFFTTKGAGNGTGLGLSIVYGIIKQQNGYIYVYSEPGKGTTFKIYLPLVREKAEDIKIAPPSLKGGTETVLVAEDNEHVRILIQNILEEFGYHVIAAKDGKDAVEKFSENKDSVGLLLLDVIMPESTGKEAYEIIKEMKPGIKVIFISGYTADIISRKGIIGSEFDIIFKPVSIHNLLTKVREVLDREKQLI